MKESTTENISLQAERECLEVYCTYIAISTRGLSHQTPWALASVYDHSCWTMPQGHHTWGHFQGHPLFLPGLSPHLRYTIKHKKKMRICASALCTKKKVQVPGGRILRVGIDANTYVSLYLTYVHRENTWNVLARRTALDVRGDVSPKVTILQAYYCATFSSFSRRRENNGPLVSARTRTWTEWRNKTSVELSPEPVAVRRFILDVNVSQRSCIQLLPRIIK